MQFNEEIILKGLNLANFELKIHQLIDSTNDECKRISSNKDILVVTADKQTKGKGRKGKKWHSPEGNISLSIAFADREFDVPISIATGILVKDASLTKIPVAILIGTSNSLSAKAMEREILPSGLCHFFPFRPFPLVCLSAVTTRISLFELILLHSSLVESIN